MKKMLLYALLVFTLAACEKNNEEEPAILNVSGIRTGGSTEIVNLQLKSGEVTTNVIPCYIFASAVFDPLTNGFGYVDCYSHFNMINPLTGEVTYSYLLPGMLNQVVFDGVDNSIIGHYYENDSNYIVKVKLDDGSVVLKKSIDLSSGVLATTYFFNPANGEYVLLRANGSLISIDPENGTIANSVLLESAIQEACFDATNKRLIGLTYSEITNQNFIEILNIETGDLLSRVQIKEKNSYHAGISGFDAETNCYILVSADNVILFIDIATGELKDSYPIAFDITEFKFWRSI